MNPLHNHPSFERGFSLIEILIAMLIFSIGIGGYMGLQVQSISVSNDAYFRMQAMHLTANLFSRIEANDKSYSAKTTTTKTITFGTDTQNQEVRQVTEHTIVAQAADLYFGSSAQVWWNKSITDSDFATYTTGCNVVGNGVDNCSTAEQRMRADIQQLRWMARNNLPNGDIALTNCAEGQNNLCVVVAWKDTAVSDCIGSAMVTVDMNCFFQKASF